VRNPLGTQFSSQRADRRPARLRLDLAAASTAGAGPLEGRTPEAAPVYVHDESVLKAYAAEATLVDVLATCGAPENADTGTGAGGPVYIVQRSVSPDVFGELWGRLRVSVEFTAPVAPNSSGGVSAHELADHLGRKGFFVVAKRSKEREREGVHRVFAFAAGAHLLPSRARLRLGADAGAAAAGQESDVDAYCLFEFSLTEPQPGAEQWSLTCVAKCSRDDLGPEFVALLLLGDLFELL